MAFGVLVVWQSGRQTYLKSWPSGERLEFSEKAAAEDTAERIRRDLVPNEAQSVNVVRLGEEPR
jgi:hypothetical protein